MDARLRIAIKRYRTDPTPDNAFNLANLISRLEGYNHIDYSLVFPGGMSKPPNSDYADPSDDYQMTYRDLIGYLSKFSERQLDYKIGLLIGDASNILPVTSVVIETAPAYRLITSQEPTIDEENLEFNHPLLVSQFCNNCGRGLSQLDTWAAIGYAGHPGSGMCGDCLVGEGY
jgi:hypothetical protein